MLPPSIYRPYLKGWKPNEYLAGVFSKHASDRKKYRIYRDFTPSYDTASLSKKGVFKRIVRFLDKHGYDLDDYIKGTALEWNNGKQRTVKIGKVLNAYIKKCQTEGATRKGNVASNLLKAFSSDPVRAAATNKEPLRIVLTRHAYDIVGKSTGRGWVSCMRVDDDYAINRNVMNDITYGTVEAYCIRASDPGIKNPICRLSIKPFLSLTGDADHSVLMVLEGKVYGEEVPGFRQRVGEVVREVFGERQAGLYELKNCVYQDRCERLMFIEPMKVVKKIRETPTLFLAASVWGQQLLLMRYPSLMRSLGSVINITSGSYLWDNIRAELNSRENPRTRDILWKGIQTIEKSGVTVAPAIRGNILYCFSNGYGDPIDVSNLGARQTDYNSMVSLGGCIMVPDEFQFEALKHVEGYFFPNIINRNDREFLRYATWFRKKSKKEILSFVARCGYSLFRYAPLKVIKRMLSSKSFTADQWYTFYRDTNVYEVGSWFYEQYQKATLARMRKNQAPIPPARPSNFFTVRQF
jgi:hypothetical protein